MEASNCSEWCDVEWKGQKGYSIATALDRSGRAPPPRRAAGPPRGPYATDVYDYDGDMVAGPYYPAPVYGPPVYYGYRPYYGYRGYGYGYRGYGYRGYRR